jgi:hypothetical protein
LLCQIRSRNHSKIISREPWETRETSTVHRLQLSISRDQPIVMGGSIKTTNCSRFSMRRAADCIIPTRSVSEGQFRTSLTYVSGYDR